VSPGRQTNPSTQEGFISATNHFFVNAIPALCSKHLSAAPPYTETKSPCRWNGLDAGVHEKNNLSMTDSMIMGIGDPAW